MKLLCCNIFNSAVLSWQGGGWGGQFKLLLKCIHTTNDNNNDNGMVTQISRLASHLVGGVRGLKIGREILSSQYICLTAGDFGAETDVFLQVCVFHAQSVLRMPNLLTV